MLSETQFPSASICPQHLLKAEHKVTVCSDAQVQASAQITVIMYVMCNQKGWKTSTAVSAVNSYKTHAGQMILPWPKCSIFFPSHLSYKYYYSVQIADTLPNTVYVEQCLDHVLNSSKKLTRVKDKMRDAWLKLSCLHPFLYWNMTKCQSSILSTVVFIDHNEPHNEPHIKKSNLKHLLAVFTAASDVILMFAVLIAALFHEPGNPATMLT